MWCWTTVGQMMKQMGGMGGMEGLAGMGGDAAEEDEDDAPDSDDEVNSARAILHRFCCYGALISTPPSLLLHYCT